MKVYPLLLALLCAFPASRQMLAQYMEKVHEWEEMLPEVNDSTKVMILGYLFYEFFQRDHERIWIHLTPLWTPTEKYYRENNLNNDLAGLLEQLGIIAKEQGKLDEAEACYLEALELGQKNGEKTLPGILCRRLAILYMEKSEE